MSDITDQENWDNGHRAASCDIEAGVTAEEANVDFDDDEKCAELIVSDLEDDGTDMDDEECWNWALGYVARWREETRS